MHQKTFGGRLPALLQTSPAGFGSEVGTGTREGPEGEGKDRRGETGDKIREGKKRREQQT